MNRCIIFTLVGFLISGITVEYASSQGLSSTWLLGYQSKARMNFTNTSYSISPEVRKIPFYETQGNISNVNGTLLISSNGIFISDVTGDTMQNGAGINPGQFTSDFSNNGLPIPYGNIVLPMPGDSNKFVLIHQTGNYNAPSALSATEIYYSEIDMTLNSGYGSVTSKNNVIISGSFGWGIAACKHANGRDWWIVALSDSAKIAFNFLLTPNFLQFISSQNLSIPGFYGFVGQPTFSPDGNKFAFASSNGNSLGFWTSRVQLFNFDRCSGNLVLDTLIDYSDGNVGIGTAFSPNSKYLYFSTTEQIYQIDTDTSNIGATYQLVALNDTFQSAPPVFYTNFYLMYLAANGKIYISSTSSVLHLHEMNYPDSAGVACDVQLHNIYTTHFYIGVPNHPNYYLGALTGSPCDTLGIGMSELEHDFKFSVSPNPATGDFRIMYLLPQHQSGKLEIYDVNGRRVYEMHLPPWSTMQYVSLPSHVASGIYHCVIGSGDMRVNKKIAVIKE